ncbi:GtrA family protein [Aliarcobacter cibarius]|uniref:GtrA family protein n=1 Tax=Aliarcobacter cibarius TaxID=255507 RepID=A0ABY2VAI7_9BACT|nr:GtrA family protein [Aliarcobacter cibarius]TLT01307.1 GtrA family protein [Aliarcobacter cibarius]TLT01712.1 GtrA family protein [Aliarcobacter cibarius]
MLAEFKSKQFISFLFVGGFAAVVNFGSRFFYSEFLSYGNAVILAYITGMITAFILTKLFVFEKSIHSTKKEFYYFTLVNIVAVIQTYIISVGFAKYLFPTMGFELYPEVVAHAIGVIFPVFTSFIGHKYFSFRRVDEKS